MEQENHIILDENDVCNEEKLDWDAWYLFVLKFMANDQTRFAR